MPRPIPRPASRPALIPSTAPDRATTTVSTIIIFSVDIRRLADFYRTGLDLGAPDFVEPDHIGFRLPNLYLGFDRVAERPPAPDGAVTLWFTVDDVNRSFQRLVELGAPVKMPPTRKNFGDVIAALYDPDGSAFGLAQRRV